MLEPFLNRLTERLEHVVMGNPLDESVNYGPMISQTQLDIVKDYIRSGLSDGARLVCGGSTADAGGLFLQPTVFADVTDNMTIAREEIFGPVMSVLTFDTEEEAVSRANATEFGLAAGVFTQDLARAHRVAAQFEAGTCYINTYNLTPVEAPFGGMKHSGQGVRTQNMPYRTTRRLNLCMFRSTRLKPRISAHKAVEQTEEVHARSTAQPIADGVFNPQA